MSVEPGQVYRSCDPRGGPSIRILPGWLPGHNKAWVVDAVTGKRGRWILVGALHDSPTTKTGRRRRTGYALETK